MNTCQRLLIIIAISWMSFSSKVVASHCFNHSLDVLSFDHQQNLIKVVDATTVGDKEAKKVTSIDAISVEGLTPELFQQIIQQPELIAEVMGGKLISMKSNSDFVLEIPGILGFDLRFNVKTRIISENKLGIDLSEFNTFFYKGEGSVDVEFSADGNAILHINGDAYIPRTPAKVFIWGVGGENNFKKMLQEEVNKQTAESLKRFQVMSESLQ